MGCKMHVREEVSKEIRVWETSMTFEILRSLAPLPSGYLLNALSSLLKRPEVRPGPQQFYDAFTV